MLKVASIASFCLFTVGCTHARVASTAPASPTAREVSSTATCSLLTRRIGLSTHQGDAYRPVYRITPARGGISFFTADSAPCVALGFMGDDTPERYAVAEEVADPNNQCRVYTGAPQMPTTAGPNSRPVGQVVDVASGFTMLTLDIENCARQGLVLDTIVGYVEWGF